MINHLTLTGPLAGKTFCGAQRRLTETYAHLPYCSLDEMTVFVNEHVECDKCKKVYQDDYVNAEDDNN